MVKIEPAAHGADQAMAVQPQCNHGATSCESGILAMDAVASWDGGKADALRCALRMTNEQFAEHLGIVARTVAYWRKNPDMVPLPRTQEILDAALASAPEQAKAQFWLLQDESERSGELAGAYQFSPLVQVQRISAWLGSTNVSDDAVEALAQATKSLAYAHIQAPPQRVLPEVLRLHK